MKIKIKEFAGQPVVRGFFPKEGFRLLPGEEYEFKDEEESLFWDCIETGLVEEVRERPQRPASAQHQSEDKPKRGRPRKEPEADVENAQPRA